MALNVNPLTAPAPIRGAEGYSKEIFSGEDPTAVTIGVGTEAGVQIVAASLFLDMLKTLRRIEARIAGLSEPTGVSTDLLR